MKVLLGSAACLLIGLTFLLTVSTFNAQKSEDICQVFPHKTEIRDPDSCSSYITCLEGVSNYHDCPASTPFYDKAKGCVKSLPANSTCHISCSDYVGKFLADPKSCKNYYYCKQKELPTPGKCPDEMHFNETLQSCVYKIASNCRAHTLNVCSVVKDGINFKDTENCQKYYVCAKGNITSKACKSKYYDTLSGTCMPKSMVNCPKHPLPKNVCGTSKKPLRNEFAGDEATCRGYFYCRDMTDGPDPNPAWAQCDDDKFFSVAKQACIDPVMVQCAEDRCDGRTLTFVSSGTAGCRHYLRCSKGVTLGQELSCGNSFFNETMGACVNARLEYPACSPKKSTISDKRPTKN